MNIFALDTYSSFALLHSRLHEAWARLLSSSLKDRLRYTASDRFETFPFPKQSPRADIPSLEAIGKELYEARPSLMVDTDQGLTKTYNALKDPTITERSEHGPRIVHLRELHLAMDRAVLAAYAAETGDASWTDIETPPSRSPRPRPRRTTTSASKTTCSTSYLSSMQPELDTIYCHTFTTELEPQYGSGLAVAQPIRCRAALASSCTAM